MDDLVGQLMPSASCMIEIAKRDANSTPIRWVEVGPYRVLREFVRVQGGFARRVTVTRDGIEGVCSQVSVPLNWENQLVERMRTVGWQVDLDGDAVRLARNGPRPRRRQRAIDVRGPGVRWQVLGRELFDRERSPEAQLILRDANVGPRLVSAELSAREAALAFALSYFGIIVSTTWWGGRSI